MEGEGIFSSIASPIFDGENYQVWLLGWKTTWMHHACGLCEAVEEDY